MFGELSSMGRPLPNNCRLQFSQHVPLREAAMRPNEIKSFVQSKARDALAHMIAETRTQRIEGDFHVEFRTDVYVFSPDEFWRIVETAAVELTRRMEAKP